MRLLIVDDHPVMREGLAVLLRQFGPDTVVLQAGSSAEGLAIVGANPALDIVLLDLLLPDLAGTEAIAAFGELRPDLPLVVVSASEEPADVRRALAAGALGYVPKSAAGQTILGAVRLVLTGELYVPPLLLNEPTARGGGRAAMARMTGRQHDVLRLIGEGHSNKQIAQVLGLSDKTVKAHVTAVFRALSVANRTQAANAARGVLSGPM